MKSGKVTLFIPYKTSGESNNLINKVRETCSDVEMIVCSGSLRPPIHFPFIKDEEGRPYYGKEGINFYLERRITK